MSDDERRDAMNEELRERFRKGFSTPDTDGEDHARLLTVVRERASRRARDSRLPAALRVAAVSALAGVMLVAGGLQPWRDPEPVVPSSKGLTAAFVLQRALAAMSGKGEILHVKAVTEYTTIVPTASGEAVEPSGTDIWGPVRDRRHRHAPPPAELRGPNQPIFPEPPGPHIRRVTSEHWVDTARGERHSTNLVSWPPSPHAFDERVELMVEGTRRMKLDQQISLDGRQDIVALDTDVADPARTLGENDVVEFAAEDPAQHLQDTSDPGIYHSLLTSGTVPVTTKDVNGRPPETSSTVTLLGDSFVAGVPTVRVRILNRFHYATEPGYSTETSLVVDLRRTDYLPMRVEGGVPGRSWVTTFTAVEWRERADVPRSAFRVSLPEGSRWRVNRRLAASEIPSATVIPARWLGDDFGKLRSTGFLRLLDHGVEYESMRMPGSASVRADEARPDLGETYVLAEYTPDGSLGNMGQKDTPVLKAITFSRVDPREWQADSRADMSSGVTTAGRTEWLTVAGHKALAIHRGAVAAPDPPTSPNVGVTIDYLIVDMGDSTVLLQGANTGYRLLEQAATKLVPAR